jgi:Kyakuja-Dileera-Zisupton transposase
MVFIFNSFHRYINSDYGLSCAFKGMQNLKEIVLSYDIACQYSRNINQRFAMSTVLDMPDALLIYAVPKFHLPAHIEKCRYHFSLNYIPNVGRTDGEAIERLWSQHNFLSGSTSRMTPEARLDTINAHFADWNWRKLCGMGMFLLFSIFARVAEHLTGVTLQSRLQNAQRQRALHTE